MGNACSAGGFCVNNIDGRRSVQITALILWLFTIISLGLNGALYRTVTTGGIHYGNLTCEVFLNIACICAMISRVNGALILSLVIGIIGTAINVPSAIVDPVYSSLDRLNTICINRANNTYTGKGSSNGELKASLHDLCRSNPYSGTYFKKQDCSCIYGDIKSSSKYSDCIDYNGYTDCDKLFTEFYPLYKGAAAFEVFTCLLGLVFIVIISISLCCGRCIEDDGTDIFSGILWRHSPHGVPVGGYHATIATFPAADVTTVNAQRGDLVIPHVVPLAGAYYSSDAVVGGADAADPEAAGGLGQNKGKSRPTAVATAVGFNPHI